MNATDSIQHEYGPFGEVIRATGPMTKTHPFRFSTTWHRFTEPMARTNSFLLAERATAPARLPATTAWIGASTKRCTAPPYSRRAGELSRGGTPETRRPIVIEMALRTIRKAGALVLLSLGPQVGHSAATTDFELRVSPALELRWSGADGHVYQVCTNADLTDWRAAGNPVLGLGGTNSFVFVTEGQPNQHFKIQELPGVVSNRFIGLQEFGWDSAGVAKEPQGLTLLNLHVQCTNLSSSDSVLARFGFDLTNQALQLSSYQTIPGPGVYNEPYFSLDNTNAILLCQTNAASLAAGPSYMITTDGSEFYLDLSLGQVLCFNIGAVTNDFWFRLTDPEGQMLENRIWPARVAAVTPAYPVLKTGRYHARFIPLSASRFTFQLSFLNANGRLLTPIGAGSTISVTLAAGSRDYAKYWVDLATNQVLSLPEPSSFLRFTLLDEDCENVAGGQGLPLKFQPPVAGRFFLFLDHSEALGGTYTATVSVTSAPSPAVAGASQRLHQSTSAKVRLSPAEKTVGRSRLISAAPVLAAPARVPGP